MAGLVMIFSRSEWRIDLEWAINWAHGSTILIGPACAGLAAFATTKNYSHSFQYLANTTLRGGQRVLLDIFLWVWLAATVAWLTCICIAAGASLLEGFSSPGRTWWGIVTGPAVLAATTGLGVTLGAAMRTLAAAPFAAGLTYLVALATFRLPMPRFLWDGGATGALGGLQLDPRSVTATGLLNIAAAVAFLCTAAVLTSTRRRMTVSATLLVAFLVCMTIVVTSWGRQHYTFATNALSCTDTVPQVCTLPDSNVDAEAIGVSLASNLEILEAAGLTGLPRIFSEVPLDDPASTVLFRSDGPTIPYPGDLVAAAISFPPHRCDVPEENAEVVGQASGTLALWIGHLLGSEPEPPLTNLEISTLESWAPGTLVHLRECEFAELTLPPGFE